MPLKEQMSARDCSFDHGANAARISFTTLLQQQQAAFVAERGFRRDPAATCQTSQQFITHSVAHF
jgi:hypothetical protein